MARSKTPQPLGATSAKTKVKKSSSESDHSSASPKEVKEKVKKDKHKARPKATPSATKVEEPLRVNPTPKTQKGNLSRVPLTSEDENIEPWNDDVEVLETKSTAARSMI